MQVQRDQLEPSSFARFESKRSAIMPEDRNLPMGGQWAKQQKRGMEKQEAAQVATERHPTLSDEEQQKLEEDVAQDTAGDDTGEDRTPDQVIGQVAHADGQKRQSGGAGEPQTTLMEPEKQGGISGP
jgi:hypothetical protein